MTRATRATSADEVEYVYVPPACSQQEAASRNAEALLRCHAPVFVLEQGARPYNRIGTPAIRLEGGREKVRVNPDLPAAFSEIRRDRIGSKPISQLVYRIHFTRLPFKPSVFFEMHRNVGVLAIVTLVEPELAPILLTTVYTCGCYRVLLPTELFPREELPPDWPAGHKRLYGRDLPAVLKPPRPGRSRFVIRITSKTHRVAAIQTLDEPSGGRRIDLPLRPMEDLRRLPVAGKPGAVSSFFYSKGPLKGHVRGAWSPIEGSTAGVLLLDLALGMDKDFGDPEVTGTRFYTSLLPWKRDVSRLDRLDSLLHHMRFRPV